ncbi:MAG: ABC transporter substrate-binding protein [Bacillota bacterium]
MSGKRFVRRILPAIMALVFVFAVAGCGGGGQAKGEKIVKIGVAQPLTGSAANDGKMSRDGAALALEHAKGRSELAGYKIELISEDDKSDPKDAAAIANKFAGDDKVLAVIGNYNSSCTLAAAPILTKAGIPQISTGSSSPKITGYSKFLFRTQPTDALVGANIVNWASELGFKKAAVIYENSDFGKGLHELYKELWPKDGRVIVAEESYLPGSTTDFTPILTKVKSAGADVVLLGSLYNEAALMGKQSRQVGLAITYFGDSSQHTNALIDLGKENVGGWHVIGCLDPTAKDEKATKFFSDFKQKYGNDPNTFAAQAYDAMMLVLEGLAKNGPDRAKLQEYLFTVKDYPGITGKLTFKNGDVDKKLFRFVVKDGKFVAVEK